MTDERDAPESLKAMCERLRVTAQSEWAGDDAFRLLAVCEAVAEWYEARAELDELAASGDEWFPLHAEAVGRKAVADERLRALASLGEPAP